MTNTNKKNQCSNIHFSNYKRSLVFHPNVKKRLLLTGNYEDHVFSIRRCEPSNFCHAENIEVNFYQSKYAIQLFFVHSIESGAVGVCVKVCEVIRRK